MWVIYERPADYPDGYVVRLWYVSAQNTMEPGEARTYPTLEAARDALPQGLFPVPRSPKDDEKIVESWF
jgi:hypothetical protein